MSPNARILPVFSLTAALLASAPCLAGIEIGATRADVVAELGIPEFEYSRGGNAVLSYFGHEIELKDGVVVEVPEDFSARIERGQAVRKERVARDSAQVRVRARVKPEKKRRARAASSVRVVSNGGKKIRLQPYLKQGKVTVVDFYADWCGPCRQLAPALERLAQQDPDVNLVKVDIVRWGTPVAKQFGIRSIPYVRVYNARGKPVGEPTHDLSEIVENVAKAK